MNDNEVTESELKLIKLLKNYPHPNHDKEGRQCSVIYILLAGRENGWTDDFVRICENNPNATFDEILDLIFTEERFPPLEIVDDDEDD